MKQASERNNWIDISKGIAIILMVLGHSSLPHFMGSFIYAFHMPLFFIASGYTTHWGKYTFKEFLKRKVNTLLIPFFVYSAIVLFLMSYHSWMSLDEWLTRGWSNGYALWFIPVLFISLIGVKFSIWVAQLWGGVFYGYL